MEINREEMKKEEMKRREKEEEVRSPIAGMELLRVSLLI